MSNKPTHDILLAENFEAGDCEQKSYFTNIGSAWQKDSSAISCEMRDGLAVSGRFVILPKKAKDEAYLRAVGGRRGNRLRRTGSCVYWKHRHTGAAAGAIMSAGRYS